MRKRKNQHGHIRPVDIFFFVLLIILLIGGTIYFFRVVSSSKGDIPIVNQPYVEENNSNNVFTDQGYGFSMLYPKDWRFSDVMKTEMTVAIESYVLTDLSVSEENKRVGQDTINPNHTITIDIFSADDYNVDEPLSMLTDKTGAKLEIDKANSILLWSKPAMMITGRRADKYIKCVTFIHPDNNFAFLITAVSTNQEMPAVLSQAHNMIIESIKLF